MSTARRLYRASLLLGASAPAFILCSVALAQEATPVPDVSVTATQTGIPAPTIGQPADAEGFKNVVVTRQTTGSKTDAPITDVPQSIVVIPNKIIDDQNITNQADALQNVAGVQITGFPGYTLNGNYALIRGFSVSEYMLNGLYDQTNAANLPIIGQNVERIEVLKGSSALLYGPTIGSIGGIVNTVTKKPLLNPAYLFGTTVDNYGMAGLYMDVSHPLTDDKSWLVRVTGDLKSDPTFVQNGRQRIGDGSVTIQGQIDPATTLTFFYQHVGLQANQIMGQPIFPDLPYSFQFPRNANPSVLQAQPYQAQSDALQLELDHQLNSEWISRTSLGWVRNTNYNSQYGVSWNTDGTGSWYYYHEHFDRAALSLDTNFNGKFLLFGHANDLVVGASYLYNPTFSNYFSPNGDLINGTISSPINIPRPQVTWASDVEGNQSYYYSNKANFYLNDVVDIVGGLKLSAGVSYTIAQDYFHYNTSNDVKYSNSQSGVAFRVGPIYYLTPDWTVYSSYATTFVPQNYPHSEDGVTVYPAKALQGDQIEIGTKYAVTNQASITAALYQLTEKNVLVTSSDPVLAAEGVREQIGEARSRGVELDFAYRPLPGWDITASYAFTSAKVISDTNVDNLNHQLSNVPYNAGSFWSTYEFQDGPLKGLGFGGGLHAQSSSPIQTNATYRLPAWAEVNALVYYKYDGWRFSANITNLFNTRYYQSSTSFGNVFVGQPLTVAFRIQKQF